MSEPAARLALTRLRLVNFRSYRRLDLALDGRPVAVFGANGAGKTNLIEAISLLSPGRGLRRALPSEMVRAREAEGWRVAAELATPAGLRVIETGAEDGARHLRIDGKAAAQTALSGVVRLMWLTPAMDRLWTEAAGERRRFLDRIALSLMPDHAGVALDYDKALRGRNRMLRDGVRDGGWYDAVERQMAASGARLSANRRAAVARLNAVPAAEGFPAARLDLQSAVPERAEDFQDALRTGRRADAAAGRSLTGPHRDDLGAVYRAKDMPARLCSTGEQKALLISLVLANAGAVAADFGAPPLLLLDEVAAHLDADRRAALFEAICAKGAQAWMTGTEAALFDGIGARAAWLEMREADGASEVVAL